MPGPETPLDSLDLLVNRGLGGILTALTWRYSRERQGAQTLVLKFFSDLRLSEGGCNWKRL